MKILMKCNAQRTKTIIPMRDETLIKSSSLFEIVFQKLRLMAI